MYPAAFINCRIFFDFYPNNDGLFHLKKDTRDRVRKYRSQVVRCVLNHGSRGFSLSLLVLDVRCFLDRGHAVHFIIH
jgi:hypothetical protein